MTKNLNVEVDALNLGSLKRGVNRLVADLRHLLGDAERLHNELEALTPAAHTRPQAPAPNLLISTQPPRPQLLRLRDVIGLVGLSRSTVWRLAREGKFPAPCRLTGKAAVAWFAADIETWIASRREA